MTDQSELVNALVHLERVQRYLTAARVDSDVTLDACALRLSAALDCLGRLDHRLRESVIPPDEWLAMRGLRNRIAHAYTFVTPTLLENTMRMDVPTLHKYVLELNAKLTRI